LGPVVFETFDGERRTEDNGRKTICRLLGTDSTFKSRQMGKSRNENCYILSGVRKTAGESGGARPFTISGRRPSDG